MKKTIEVVHIFKNQNSEKREKELEKKLVNLIKYLDANDTLFSAENKDGR